MTDRTPRDRAGFPVWKVDPDRWTPGLHIVGRYREFACPGPEIPGARGCEAVIQTRQPLKKRCKQCQELRDRYLGMISERQRRLRRKEQGKR